jgi:hypothetical protein
MSLRVYATSIVLTWAIALLVFTFITRGDLWFAALVLLSYCCVMLRFVFKLDVIADLPSFRFVGSHDKPRKELE